MYCWPTNHPTKSTGARDKDLNDLLFITSLWVECTQLGHSSEFTFCFPGWSHFQLRPRLGLKIPRWPQFSRASPWLAYHHLNLAQTSLERVNQLPNNSFPNAHNPYLSVYKASAALITLARIILAKTSQVAKPMVNVKGTTRGHKYKRTVYHRSMKGSTAQQAQRTRKLSNFDLH